MTKKQIVADIRQYLHNTTLANDCISLLKTIDSSETEYFHELNLAPTFFGVTKQALINSVIIETYKLFDFSIKNDEVTYNSNTKNIGKLLNMLEMNIHFLQNPLCDGELIGDSPKDFIKSSVKDYKNNKDLLVKLKYQRDKIYAHSDSKHFSNKDQKSLAENNITYGEIESLLMLVTMILNSCLHYLNEIPHMTLSVNTNDLKFLLERVK